MLLCEIKRTPPKVLPQYHKTLNPDDHPDRYTPIGSGIGAGIMDSKIYLDKKHPNQVLKVVPIRNTSDAYYKFLRMIEHHQNNPFFPKIHGIRLYDIEAAWNRSEHTGIEYEMPAHLALYVWMERLHPLTSLDDSHVRQLLKSIGIDYEGKLKNDMSLRYLFSEIQTRKEYSNQSLNPKFVEAMRLLEPMIKKLGNDIHIENLMIRLTGVGPQIVIVDPLYPSFEDAEY